MYLCLYPLNSEGWALWLGLCWPHYVCHFQYSEHVDDNLAACVYLCLLSLTLGIQPPGQK